MKKGLYMFFLLVSACVLGGFGGSLLKDVAPWLGKNIHIDFDPGNFLRTDVLSITFGISFTINLLQIIFMAIAIYVFYKTAPKLIS